MADPRTFTLIGEFKDGITPELQKINNQLAALKSNFAGVGSKKNTGFRGASQEVGKLVSAHKNLSKSLQEVQTGVRSTTKALNDYRLEMAKATKATREFKKAGGSAGSSAFAQNMRAANNEAKQYLKTLQAINKATPRAMRPPSGGGGGGRSGKGGGGGGAGPGGFHMAEFGFAFTLGNAIAQPIQNAIVSGFQIGVAFMTKPFEYFANRLGERMQDELSDLKAAGGFYSMAKRQKDPFVKNFAEAIQFTQENNKVMAQLAASLPGKTQDYIEVAKRISDSVARTVLNDRAATLKMAEQIRAGDIKTYGAKSITEMSGDQATKKAIQVLLGDLTKDTVLAGMGGRAGAGGAMGAYGLPQLSERMISQDEVSMGQMQRYSAIFSDPMIMDALQRNIDKINATSKNSAERLKAIANMYKEVVTPELVERYRRTLAGVQETFNTAIFGEETGLFGLGRKMEGLGVKFNEYGQMLDKTGKVTTDLTQAAREDLSIYDLFRDILVNVGQVIAPIVENLSLIYDPLKQLGIDLNKAREATYKILESFNYYKKGFEEFGQQFKGKDKEKFDATRDLRAALATISNVMRYFKVIGEGEFSDTIKQLEDPNAKMGPILQKMIDQFMTSDVAGKIGEFIGNIIGTVLTEVAKATGFISGRLEQSNKLLEGLKKGFDDAGGTDAIKNIFKDVFKSLFNLLVKVLTLIPMEGYMLMGFMLVAPAAAQALGMAIGAKVASLFGEMMSPLGGSLLKGAAKTAPKGAAAAASAGGKVGGGGLAGAFTTRRQAAYARLMRQRAAARTAPLAQGAKTLGAFGKDSFKGLTMALGASKFGQAMTKVAKFIPGGAVAAGVLDAGIRMMSGQGAGQALGGAGAAMGGSAIGAMIGSVIAPGIGTAIGGIAGGILGDMAFQKLSPVLANLWPWADRQKIAADKQLSAAEIQMAAARETRRKLGIPEVGAAEAGVSDPGKLMKVLEMMGLSGDKQARTLLQQSGTLDLLTQRTSEAGNLLNAKIEELRKLKYTDAQIAAQGDVKALQANFNRLQKESKTAAENLNKTFAAMPQATSRGITTAMQKIDTKTIEYAIANKINMMPPPQIQWNNIAPGAPAPGAPSPIFTPPTPAPKKGGWALGNPFGGAKGSLGDAIASEMRMKPPGSDLVIANSSETVIPAAGGYGMVEFVDTLKWGFATMISTFKQAQQKQDSLLNGINQTLKSNQQQTNMRLSAMEKKFASPGMPGGLGGGAAGGVDAFTPIAQRMGLTMTSGYRPGDPGWHGANRARDFSNGTGPTPQMMQFAQYMAATYGSNLKELIYTPLGFSIKNGQRVPPYAQGSHYNHVHVAYAAGFGNPALFGDEKDAQRWEKKHLGAGVKSITTNTAEFGGLLAELRYGQGVGKKPGGGQANWMQILEQDYLKNLNKPVPGGPSRNSGRGGLDMWEGPGSAYISPGGMYSNAGSSMASAPINITAPITINQQPGQDADELASIVAMKISEAVSDARAASLFV